MATLPITLRILRELKEKARLAAMSAESFERRQAWLKVVQALADVERFYTEERRLERAFRQS
jgi:hypothetical protein